LCSSQNPQVTILEELKLALVFQ